MGALGEYVIPYLGLANGVHSYTFHVDRHFFEHFETSKLKDGTLTLSVDFDKLDRMITLHINCDGSYEARCDRCTSHIHIPMQYEDQVIIKLEEASDITEAEVIFADPKSSEIDLAPILYESIHLHMPMLNVKDCESEGYNDCDHDVLDKLEGGEVDKLEVKDENGVWSELRKLNLN